MMWADLTLMSGKVLTMNPSQSHAEAIAIKNDRIVKVGANGEISRWIGKSTKVISLKGRTVVPGFRFYSRFYSVPYVLRQWFRGTFYSRIFARAALNNLLWRIKLLPKWVSASFKKLGDKGFNP